MNDKLLTVYKASAGSGKTFTLSVEYISLLMKAPENFRHILAVTFTNKATEEMKMRILGQLYGIANNLEDSKDYLEQVVKRTGLNEDIIIERCKDTLHRLLHNYNYFRVETIDSFFQSVLKNLARELNLTPNLKVDLADTAVKDMAVDLLLENIDKDNKLREQVVKFIRDSIADDKGWDVTGRIKEFGSTIFKDVYKSESEKINNCVDVLPDFEETLRNIRNDFREKMTALADECAPSPEDSNRYVDTYYKRIAEGTYTDDKLLNASLLKTEELIEKPESYRRAHLKDYLTADAIYPYLNQLGLLEKIDLKVKELNNEADRFLLGDTQHLLNSMTDSENGADAPFIYEKIGSRLSHIMIDEFQDTSIIQWENFKVLLKECLSRNNESLVVGDVKQSIYRWRSGDWNLLNNIGCDFPNEMDDVPLKTNFRSDERIVEFNNAFFLNAKEVEKDSLEKVEDKALIDAAYDKDSIAQEIKKQNNRGYVRVTLFGKSEIPYAQRQMEGIYSTIKDLKSKQVADKDIRILLRTNGHIADIANYFAENYPDVKIVSDEAFLLSSSPAINIIVFALRLLSIKSIDEICLAQLAALWYQSLFGKTMDDSILMDKEKLMSILPETFWNEKDALSSTPLYDLVERLIQIFKLDTLANQTAYLCTFQDNVLSFVNSNPSDIRMFLNEWETRISKLSIQEDEVDGIKILSIHKSKGLEFKHVIIPFCDWQKENANTIIWLPTEGKPAPFSDIPLVPIKYNSSLAYSHFDKEYRNEHLQNIIDNLNLVYVGFTRAGSGLYVFGKNGGSKNISAMIQQTLNNIIKDKKLDIKKTESGEKKNPDLIFEYGDSVFEEEQEKDKKASGNVFNQQPETHEMNIHTSSSDLEFRQSNEANFFAEDEENHNENREKGLLLHNILSEIITADDMQRVIDKYDIDGQFGSIISREEAENEISKCLSNKKMSRWFDGSWKVLNERDILSNRNLFIKKNRCDRVVYNDKQTIVIDFKFGEREKKHIYQVKNYIHLLSEIGFKNVSGYLYYANEDKVDQVL